MILAWALAPQTRTTHNSNPGAEAGEGDGAVDPAVLWRRYEEGCSVRLLHPQRWCERLARRLACLEDVFQSCVGCNAYLTPPGSRACPITHSALCLLILSSTVNSLTCFLFPFGQACLGHVACCPADVLLYCDRGCMLDDRSVCPPLLHCP